MKVRISNATLPTKSHPSGSGASVRVGDADAVGQRGYRMKIRISIPRRDPKGTLNPFAEAVLSCLMAVVTRLCKPASNGAAT